MNICIIKYILQFLAKDFVSTLVDGHLWVIVVTFKFIFEVDKDLQSLKKKILEFMGYVLLGSYRDGCRVCKKVTTLES